MNSNETNQLVANLSYLKLPWIKENFEDVAVSASEKQWAHARFLSFLMEGESNMRQGKATERRIKAAQFPVIKTLDQFNWDYPKKINRQQIQNLARLTFIEQKANVILLGPVGVGKSHLATSLAYKACLQGYKTLFTSAAEIINTLSAAQAAQRLKLELKKYLKPKLLLIDELGFMPIDKQGADFLFQVISQRYERGSIILTSNKAYKSWPSIFNNDSMATSAILDRLLHHAETVTITGTSYKMKDQVKPQD